MDKSASFSPGYGIPKLSKFHLGAWSGWRPTAHNRAENNGGAIAEINNLESFARKFTSAIFFQHVFGRFRTACRGGKEDHSMYRSPPRIQLYGTSSADEHFERIEWAIKTADGKYGLDGLRTLGFEYRLLACSQHRHLQESDKADEGDKPLDAGMDGNIGVRLSFPLYGQCNEEKRFDNNKRSSKLSTLSKQVVPISDMGDNAREEMEGTTHICPDCSSRLHHIESDTLITLRNRSTFIADGEMYEVVVRLCQEYAQDLIRHEASLHWISICEDREKGLPIRALVHRDYAPRELEASTEPKGRHHRCAILPNTLLITTGRGKVRAGIFSRQHLLVSGIEASTCLKSVREAQKRGMRVIILDPNARGDRNAMSTYTESLRVIFRDKIDQFIQRRDQNSSLFVLAHSASGSYLTQHLMHDGSYLIHYLRAVAFTDSNHSVQWLKKHPELSSFVQSPYSLYVRSANEYRDYDCEKRVPGELCETDKLWKHRFGDIRTIWAGTKDHSLGNWTAHSFIWEHFDKHLGCNGTNVKILQN